MATSPAPSTLERAFAAWKKGQLEDARVLCEDVLHAEPQNADALHLLGLVERQSGKTQRAAELLDNAIALQPRNFIFHLHHGLALQDVGKVQAAVASFDRAIALNPESAVAYFSRGNARQQLKDMEAAVADYRHAVAIRPQYAGAFLNCGNVLRTLGRLDEAIACYEKALEASPGDAQAHSNLANALAEARRPVEAEANFQKAIALNPADAKAHYRLASLYQAEGRLVEAEASCRKAISLSPDYARAYQLLIFILDLTVSDAATLQSVRWQWVERFAPPQSTTRPFANARDPDRRIRIGYVSGDFCAHSATVVFGAMLSAFDAAAFEVFAYSNSSKVDEITRAFQQSVTQWREIELSDDAVDALIREDGIDILVDLSGHSPGNRLGVFARRAAPVQVTAWGYITGTGLKAIDAIFVDPVVVPESEKALYAETVVYLPNVMSAFFPMPHPDITALPALSGSGVTFGSFNRLCKVSDETIAVWGRVLRAVPNSRMILKTAELEYAHLRARTLVRFSAAGVDPTRITLLGRTPWQEHQAAYNQVDISLDPFPHCGGVTALEGLMMGVPIVTLRGSTVVGRLSASIATTLGMPTWIADTEDEYVAIAAEKAKNLDELRELRQTLRPRLRRSIIGDRKAYVAAVEREYRRLWRAWCEAGRPDYERTFNR